MCGRGLMSHVVSTPYKFSPNTRRSLSRYLMHTRARPTLSTGSSSVCQAIRILSSRTLSSHHPIIVKPYYYCQAILFCQVVHCQAVHCQAAHCQATCFVKPRICHATYIVKYSQAIHGQAVHCQAIHIVKPYILSSNDRHQHRSPTNQHQPASDHSHSSCSSTWTRSRTHWHHHGTTHSGLASSMRNRFWLVSAKAMGAVACLLRSPQVRAWKKSVSCA
jgi:hypothetical protein